MSSHLSPFDFSPAKEAGSWWSWSWRWWCLLPGGSCLMQITFMQIPRTHDSFLRFSCVSFFFMNYWTIGSLSKYKLSNKLFEVHWDRVSSHQSSRDIDTRESFLETAIHTYVHIHICMYSHNMWHDVVGKAKAKARSNCDSQPLRWPSEVGQL